MSSGTKEVRGSGSMIPRRCKDVGRKYHRRRSVFTSDSVST